MMTEVEPSDIEPFKALRTPLTGELCRLVNCHNRVDIASTAVSSVCKQDLETSFFTLV